MSSSLTGVGEARILELAALYKSPEASVAELLCDRYPAHSVAYTIVDTDLSHERLTYGELRRLSEKFASALADLGIVPGDRVATLMGKGKDYLVALLGIWRLGAVHVPIFTAFAPAAISFRLTESAAKIVICDATQRSKLVPGEDMPIQAPWTIITTASEANNDGALSFASLMDAGATGYPAAHLGGDAPLIQIYTSGTTGRPKGVIVPTRALAGFRAYAEFGLGLEADDLYWCAADPGWAYGLYFGIIASLSTGVPSLLFTSGFDAGKTLDILSRFDVTNFTAAPTVYRSLRAYPRPLPSITKLRCASSAGEPLTAEINTWAEEALGAVVHDHYGQTEAGMLLNNHHHPALKAPLKVGSMGRPLPGWSVLVLKDKEDVVAAQGELGRVAVEVKDSPLAWFQGYIDDPEKSAEKFAAEGRYYLTGDAGRCDEDGYYFFSSRDDDVIIMAGYRIDPFEIETIISTFPGVRESAVIAVPDETRGEVLEAYVVLGDEAPANEETVRGIQTWVKTRYAAHAFPRKVHFVESLPRTASGKIQRFVLRQKRREELASRATEVV